jgi:predicted NUDIX family NTP pyrophosphohydrolase
VPLISAGILMWRRRGGKAQVLLAHFGGPLWQNRDAGAWGIPKGLVEPGEDLAACALREFEEELGVRAQGELVPLGRIRQKGGKHVEAFALEGDLDADRIVSNHFTMEWPPGSGQYRRYAEVDRAQWMDLDTARARILPSQTPLLDRLEERLRAEP